MLMFNERQSNRDETKSFLQFKIATITYCYLNNNANANKNGWRVSSRRNNLE